jgi:hypothetical protein
MSIVACASVISAAQRGVLCSVPGCMSCEQACELAQVCKHACKHARTHTLGGSQLQLQLRCLPQGRCAGGDSDAEQRALHGLGVLPLSQHQQVARVPQHEALQRHRAMPQQPLQARGAREDGAQQVQAAGAVRLVAVVPVSGVQGRGAVQWEQGVSRSSACSSLQYCVPLNYCRDVLIVGFWSLRGILGGVDGLQTELFPLLHTPLRASASLC